MKKNSKQITKMVTGGVLAASLLLPLVPQSAHASMNQQFLSTFGGSGSDYFNSVVSTTDGGYVAVGNSNSTNFDMTGINNGANDAILVKYDSNGQKVWVKSFGGSKDDYFTGVTPTPDGGYMAVGYTASSDKDLAGLKPKNGWYDAILVKFDSQGNKQWFKSLGDANFTAIKPTSDGGYIVSGSSNGQAILVRYDANGNQLWEKSFGGSGDDNFKSVTATTGGGVIAVGSSMSTDGDMTGLNHSRYREDAIAVKFDANGNKIWTKSFGGTYDDYFNSVTQTLDGAFVAVGYTTSVDGDLKGLNKGGNDGFLIKFDTNGNKIWANTFGGSKDDYFYSVSPSSDGGVSVVGLSYSIDKDMTGLNKGSADGIVVKYDANGNKVDTKSFGGSQYDLFNSVAYSSNGGFVVAGATGSSDGDVKGQTLMGGYDAILVSYADGVSLQTQVQNAINALNQAKASLTQSNLDQALKLINTLPDSYTGKQDLLNQEKFLQAQLDVNTLTTQISQADLTSQDVITQLKTKLDATTTSVNQNVTDATLKANLLQQLANLQEKLNESQATLLVVDAENTASAGLTTLDSVTLVQSKVDVATDFINKKVTDTSVQSSLNQRLAIVQEKINEAKATLLTAQAENDLTSDCVTLAQSAVDTVGNATVKDALQVRLNVVKQVIQATDDVNKLKASLTSFETTLAQTDLSKPTDDKLNLFDKVKNLLKGNVKANPSVMDTLQASLKDIQTEAVVVANEVTALPDSTIDTIAQRKADLNNQVSNVQQVSNVLKAILDAHSKSVQEEHGDIKTFLPTKNVYLLGKERIHISSNTNLYDVTLPTFPAKDVKVEAKEAPSVSVGSIFEKNHFANDGLALQPQTVTLGSVLTDKLGAKEDIHFLSINHSLATMDDQGNATLRYKTLTVHGEVVKVLIQGQDNLIAYSSKGYINIFTNINQGHTLAKTK
ncbi:hypothetical protein PP175_26220 (plasmid) [Aneurinibacillus sp. Ricciae_BoGa-3]|uniref:hypothetical protein n=1 Tax=Aneurinibacillus sp. Ricciae_BoGa-3 TaxID=3022697 RepID=UPI00233F9574|nr:hypothetical protein [Aneurinibacillus sp. Ricciae_BoGa-3]WCK57564.1 hypothetical protein PP175_26220 [Aneurinibacillus sp. Ricciae_BoGa-3]